ncbi:MAG: IPT/TIG domain-containing protein, partial [Bdellovibrionales bacterium]|nr:IPT/TIG domain-containing protein [Bdellovibrionales bacterium]
VPNFGPAAGGYTIVISGSGFATTTKVVLLGKTAQFNVVSDETLEITVPGSAQSNPGGTPSVSPSGGVLSFGPSLSTTGSIAATPISGPSREGKLNSVKIVTAAGSIEIPKGFHYVN